MFPGLDGDDARLRACLKLISDADVEAEILRRHAAGASPIALLADVVPVVDKYNAAWVAISTLRAKLGLSA